MMMNSKHSLARQAGAVYLSVVISGIFALMYVPSKLFIWSDASATFSNIQNHEGLFRMGIVANAIMNIAFLILPLALYRLLHTVNKTHAVAMVVLAVVSVPFSFANLSYKVNALTLVNGTHYLPLDPAARVTGALSTRTIQQRCKTGVNILGIVAFSVRLPRFQIWFFAKKTGRVLDVGLLRLFDQLYRRLFIQKLWRTGHQRFCFHSR
jgi:hypothetical protein